MFKLLHIIVHRFERGSFASRPALHASLKTLSTPSPLNGEHSTKPMALIVSANRIPSSRVNGASPSPLNLDNVSTSLARSHFVPTTRIGMSNLLSRISNLLKDILVCAWIDQREAHEAYVTPHIVDRDGPVS